MQITLTIMRSKLADMNYRFLRMVRMAALLASSSAMTLPASAASPWGLWNDPHGNLVTPEAPAPPVTISPSVTVQANAASSWGLWNDPQSNLVPEKIAATGVSISPSVAVSASAASSWGLWNDPQGNLVAEKTAAKGVTIPSKTTTLKTPPIKEQGTQPEKKWELWNEPLPQPVPTPTSP